MWWKSRTDKDQQPAESNIQKEDPGSLYNKIKPLIQSLGNLESQRIHARGVNDVSTYNEIISQMSSIIPEASDLISRFENINGNGAQSLRTTLESYRTSHLISFSGRD